MIVFNGAFESYGKYSIFLWSLSTYKERKMILIEILVCKKKQFNERHKRNKSSILTEKRRWKSLTTIFHRVARAAHKEERIAGL